MYPKDEFNQRLQQALNRDQVKQIVVEIQEAFGDHHNRTLVLLKEHLDNIEYYSGVLEVSFHSDKGATTEFITWDRIRGIYILDYISTKWRPFPNLKTLSEL